MSALKDCHVLGNSKTLRHLIGFLEFKEEWVPHYPSRFKPLLKTQKQVFRFCKEARSCIVISCINVFMSQIADSCLTLSPAEAVHLLLETDTSRYAIGPSLSQSSRSTAYNSRTLLQSEGNLIVAEKETLQNIEFFREFSALLRTLPVTVRTNQIRVAFIFLQKKNQKESKNFLCWPTEYKPQKKEYRS